MAMLLVEQGLPYANPLDLAEQIVTNRDWAFDRTLDDELVAEVAGQWCNYRMWFSWQPELEAMMFSCAYDLKVPRTYLQRIAPLILLINERLWIGHFDLCGEDGAVTFRQSMLMRGTSGVPAEQLESLMDIAVEECGRFYPAFQSVMWAGQSPEDAIKFASFETFGQA